MSAEFENSWKQLQQSYLASIEDRVCQLLPLWHEGVNGQPELISDLRRHAHSIAGSGGMYGLKDLSVCAKDLELYLDEFIRSNSVADQETTTQVELLIDRMRHAAAGGEVGDDDEGDIVQVHIPEPQTDPLASLPGMRHMTILVAEDENDNRAQLVLLLESLGHTVVQAKDGAEAVKLFEEEMPELVLMDINMPKMNGYEAAAKIKSMCGEKFLPLIFISAATDDASLIEAITAGGDDFLVKPYSRVVLQTKIFAMQRIEQLNSQLALYKSRTEDEVQLAHHVYDSITDRNSKNIQGLSFWRESAGLFSGDIVFYTEGVDGLVYVFVGDFTGHGMAAALGGLVAADVFHALLEKGATPSEVITELNRKLNSLLPTGRYCACAMLAFDIESRYLSVWNCGLPEVLVKDANGVRALASKNLPLGVVQSNSLFYEVEELELPEHATLIMYSDGVTESIDREGVLYGDERLLKLIKQAGSEGEALLEDIRNDVHAHIRDGGELLDDVTLLIMKI